MPTTLSIDEANKVPVVHVGPSVIARLFGSVDSLRALEKLIDSTLTPQSRALAAEAAVQTSTLITDRSAKNVAGLLRGERSDEVVVIGAHYDHVGVRKGDPAKEDLIYNGADDNASGTSGVLAIARAFSAMPARPRRSVLFLFFAGEEKGLLGSISYTRAPLFPMKQTVAMLNLDMIGRNSRDSVTIGGVQYNPDLVAVVREQNGAFGFTVHSPVGAGAAGSDHSSFLRKGVPAVFFFTGVHGDYHQVSDEPETIDAEKAARVAQLAFRTAWRVANDTTRYPMRSRPTSLF